MTASVGDIAKAVQEGHNAPSPKLQRSTAAPLMLSTTWQRIDYATALLNEFQTVNDAGTRTVDWDAANKLITFNDTTTRNYVAYFTIEHTSAAVASPPILPPVTVQLRYTIPDAGGPGVDFHFPNRGAPSGNEYVDLSEILANSTTVDQLPVHIPAGAVLRPHGAGIEVRLSAAMPGAATVSMDYAVVYLVAT